MQNVLVGSMGISDAVLARARRVAHDIRSTAAGLGGDVRADADEILTGRAGLLGIAPAGRISAGGSTRLLAAADGWCAVTLSRDDDIEMIPAFLELAEQPADPWTALAAAVADRGAHDVVTRARMLDLPAAVLGETRAAPTRFAACGQQAAVPLSGLLVADLSSMWAGPLCGHLLAAAGATVVKVEGHRRPDGTRRGDPRFFDWMNSSKLSYATDFRDDDLRPLLEVADVVIEGSRPAALTRRGLGANQVRARPGRVWLRINGYGSEGERADRIAFGDDSAVAGGLVRSGPVFMGDAIADPLAGLEATLAVLGSLTRGGGEIVDVALAEVAANYADAPSATDNDEPVRVPATPPAAARLGADNIRVRGLIEARRVAC